MKWTIAGDLTLNHDNILNHAFAGIEGSWPAALDELLDRVLHCCYGDAWATRIGGLAAVGLLAKKCASLPSQL